jgi:hypothetical protein
VMLTRSPGVTSTPVFYFLPADELAIAQETGLNAAQIRVWADHFRLRYATEKERMDFLASDGFEKVT